MLIKKYLDRQVNLLWKEAIRKDFGSFLHQSFHTLNQGQHFMPNWHISLMGEYLNYVEQGILPRLIVNMPPRYLKSLCVSVAWPAWLLGKNPQSRLIVASYASSLSIKHSLDCRHIMQSDWYRSVFPQTQLAKGENEKHKFATTARGFRMATSVGGAVTGEGGDILIIDDPLNPLQAESEAFRNLGNRWFENTFSSRLNNKHTGGIVLVMQRLHSNDLSGFLQRKGGWQVLELPALAPQTQYYQCRNIGYRREYDSPLHEARETKIMLQRVQSEMGSYAFAAQYQQQPVMLQGGLIEREWFGRYDSLEVLKQDGGISVEEPYFIQSWDTAIKTGGQHDRSVCLTFYRIGGRVYLCDVLARRMDYPHLRRAVIAQAEHWKPQAILIEDKASGQSLLQDLRAESMLPLIAMMPTQDKLTRFAAVTPLIEAGRVYLPKYASWLGDFEQEVMTFPKGRHDDMVDALSQFLNWVKKSANRRGFQLRRL